MTPMWVFVLLILLLWLPTSIFYLRTWAVLLILLAAVSWAAATYLGYFPGWEYAPEFIQPYINRRQTLGVVTGQIIAFFLMLYDGSEPGEVRKDDILFCYKHT